MLRINRGSADCVSDWLVFISDRTIDQLTHSLSICAEVEQRLKLSQ
jgi:hypothetical protein